MLACPLEIYQMTQRAQVFSKSSPRKQEKKPSPLATQDKGLEARGDIHNLSADNKDLG